MAHVDIRLDSHLAGGRDDEHSKRVKVPYSVAKRHLNVDVYVVRMKSSLPPPLPPLCDGNLDPNP